MQSIAKWAVKVVALLALVALNAGCGVVTAITNPSAAWALSDPAPMEVVVRRVEVAHTTAEQVKRLLAETGIDDKSRWAKKTALKKADAEALLKQLGTEPSYMAMAAQGAQLRVVPAEAWARTLSSICSEESDHDSVLEALGPDVAKAWAPVAAEEEEIAKLKAQVAVNEKELEAEGKSDADKAAIEKKNEALEAQIAKIEEVHAPKVEAFLETLKSAASKAPAEAKTQFGGVLVNLKRAVDDAKLAVSVGLLRYPLALPGMTDDLQNAAKRFAADIIEEQTGSRPDMGALKPDVKLEGTDVKLTLNGVPAEKLGDIKPGELVTETTTRTTDYAGQVLSLTALANQTMELLDFETDVLEAAIEGLGVNPDSAEGAGEDLSELVVMSGAKDAKKADAPAKAPRRTPGGLAIAASCEDSGEESGETAKAEGEGEEEEAKPAKEAKEAKKDAKEAKPSKEAKPATEAKPSKETKPAKEATASKESKPKESKPATEAKPPQEAKPAAQTKPASETKPAPAGPPPTKKCDVWVTNGDTKICL